MAASLPDSPQLRIALRGILRLDGAHCAARPISTAFALEHHLKDAGARAMAAQDALMPVVRGAQGAGRLEVVRSTALAAMARDGAGFQESVLTKRRGRRG